MTRQRWCFAVQCWAQLHRDVRGFLGSILNPVMSQQRICLQGAVRPRTHANHMLIDIYHYKYMYIFIVISQEVLQGKKSLLRSNVSANSKLIFSFFFLSHRAWMFQKSKKKKKSKLKSAFKNRNFSLHCTGFSTCLFPVLSLYCLSFIASPTCFNQLLEVATPVGDVRHAGKCSVWLVGHFRVRHRLLKWEVRSLHYTSPCEATIYNILVTLCKHHRWQ